MKVFSAAVNIIVEALITNVKTAVHRKSVFACRRLLPALTRTHATMAANSPSPSSNPATQALRPPRSVMGMTELDPSRFTALCQIPILRLTFEQFQNELLKSDLRSVSLKLIGIPNVQDAVDEQNNTTDGGKDRLFKKILLRPEKIKSYNDLPQRVRSLVACPNRMVFEPLQISYENWQVADVLNAILPDASHVQSSGDDMAVDDCNSSEDSRAAPQQRGEMDKVSGWSAIGHILHLNLRESNLPYKHIIGQVLLSKHRPRIRTVVNKTQNIDTQYRFFQMELLAGEPDYIVQVKENRVQYKFDFSRVYWNPRLSTEHERLVQLIVKSLPGSADRQYNPRTIVFDMFAGVGPFVIPLAKQLPSTSRIYANDLNPECVKWLRINATTNKIDPNMLECCDSMDAGEFLRQIVPPKLKQFITTNEENEDSEDDTCGQQNFYTVHFIMNLPAMAYSFVDRFVGLIRQNLSRSTEFDQVLQENRAKFVVHLYYFDKSEYESIDKRINALLATNFALDDLKPVFVRNVAPNKDMLRVTFELPFEVLCRSSSSTIGEAENTQEFIMPSGRLKRAADDDANAFDNDNADDLLKAAKNVKIS